MILLPYCDTKLESARAAEVCPIISALQTCSYLQHHSVSLFPVAPTLERRASVKRFVSLQFLNPKGVGRTPWTGDQPVARPLPTQNNTNTELTQIDIRAGPPMWSSGQSSWLQIQRSLFRFPALPDFLRSSGSGTGSTQPREYN
jgi:hypothetical protein